VAFRLRTSKDGAELAVLKGSADVRAARGPVVQLAANQLVELDKAGQPGTPQALVAFPSLVAPGVDVRLDEGPVRLRWSPVPGAVRYRVQMSHFTSFDENVLDTLVEGAELRLASLKPDNYVWRVSSIDGRGHEGEFGFARRFTVQAASRNDAAPATRSVDNVMLAPTDNAVVEYVREARPVEFRWRESGRAFLVIARSRDLKRNIVARRGVRGAKAMVEGLKPGVHYWGVFSFGKQTVLQPLFAHPFRFVIVERQHPEVHLPPIDWK
jgi:hypothetical protein